MLRARKRPPEQKPETPKGAPSSLETLRRHRIVRVRRQNEKLRLDLQKIKGEWVPLEKIQREVLAANAVVKSQFLALGPRLAPALALVSDPQEISRLLGVEVEKICNDLAYGVPAEDGTCPCCGQRKEEEK
jgi:hypothetical protein